MKTKNQRELQKYWAEQAAKKAKAAQKTTRPEENPKPAAAAKEKSK
jgi:hypothetical protein